MYVCFDHEKCIERNDTCMYVCMYEPTYQASLCEKEHSYVIFSQDSNKHLRMHARAQASKHPPLPLFKTHLHKHNKFNWQTAPKMSRL